MPPEEMERQRAGVLGLVSHELRTPLTAIRGSATTTLDAASSAREVASTHFGQMDGKVNACRTRAEFDELFCL